MRRIPLSDRPRPPQRAPQRRPRPDIPQAPPTGPGRPPQSAAEVADRYAAAQSDVPIAPTSYQLGVMLRRRLADPDTPPGVVARSLRDLQVVKASEHAENGDVEWPAIARILLACTSVVLHQTPPASWDVVIQAFARIWERGGVMPEAAAEENGSGAAPIRLADRLVTLQHDLSAVVKRHVHSRRREAASAEILEALKKAGLGTDHPSYSSPR